MSVRSGGSFAMLLATGALVAIPLMVMYVLPQLASLSASTEANSDDDFRQPFADVLAADVSRSSEPATTMRGNGSAQGDMLPVLTQQPQTPGRTPRPSPLIGSSSFIDNRPSTTSSGHAVPVSPSRIPTSLVVHSKENAIAPSPMTTGSDPSWENAAQQLQEMGIDDYRLERGHDGESFLFICQFAPGRDARIIRRFEAEAAEPFDAVQQVLTQIQHWRERGHSSRPIRR